MANDVSNILIFGHDDAKVWTGSLGTTAPVGLAAPGAGWDDLGWLSDEGISLSDTPDQTDFYAHQGGTLVASVITRDERSIKFQCLESTAKQLGLFYSGLTMASSGSYYGGEIKGSRSISRAFIYDDYAINQALPDGSPIHERYVIPKGTVSDKADLVYKRDEMRIWEFTVKILGSYFFYTNNPAMAPSAPPAAWVATTAYAAGSMVTLGAGTAEATTAGTSGSTAPTLPGSVGGTVTDGTVVWTRRS